MSELLQANWILLVLALLIGVLVAWWVFAANRKTRIEREPEADGDKVTKRNQALIDAPPAATTLSSAANTQEVAAAPAATDAEAGAATGRAPDARDDIASNRTQTEQPPPGSAPSAEGDDLTQIKGLGPKISAQLHAMGVTSFAQIAAWDEAEIDRVDAGLGRFQGRIRRDGWVEQARYLAAGDRASFESRFGKS